MKDLGAWLAAISDAMQTIAEAPDYARVVASDRMNALVKMVERADDRRIAADEDRGFMSARLRAACEALEKEKTRAARYERLAKVMISPSHLSPEDQAFIRGLIEKD